MYEAKKDDLESIQKIYNEYGFVVIRAYIAPERIDTIRESLRRYIEDTVPTLHGKDVIRESDGEAIRNLFRMHEHDPFFLELGNNADALAIADVLVNGKAELRAVQTFSKPARVGSPVPQHQDNAYFCFTPPDAFTFWVAIDPATAENGPVHYLPGSHASGSLEHRYSGQPGNSLMMSEPRPVKKSDVFRALLAPGDAVLHHCRTIHFSGPNTSDKPRVGMVIPYAGTHISTDDELKRFYSTVSAKIGKPLYH